MAGAARAKVTSARVRSGGSAPKTTSRTRADEGRPAAGGRLPIDPRFRDRLVAVRRQQGYRRLRILIALAAVVAVIGGCVGLALSPLFAVQRLLVTGSAHLPASQIIAVSRLHMRQPMVEVDGAAVARRLDGLPWVATARVERSWPTTVRISVTERRPVALVAAGQQKGPAGPGGQQKGPAGPGGQQQGPAGPGGQQQGPAGPGGQQQGPSGVVEVDAAGRVLTEAQTALPLPRLAGLPALAGPVRPGGWLPGVSGSSTPGGPGGPGRLRRPPAGLRRPPAGPRRPPAEALGAALATAAALPAAVAARVSTVTVTSGDRVTLALMPGGAQQKARPQEKTETQVNLGQVRAAVAGPGQAQAEASLTLARQVAALATLLAKVDLTTVTQIDLTAPDRPALTPAQAPTTLSTTSRG